jgi:hypothetical protein
MMADKIAPLDAYITAKPNEPIWTVQGGDPLGGALLRIWALFARIQADVIPPQGVNYCFEQILTAANKHPPENEHERKELLIRATQTEYISWDMDAYRSGYTDARPETPSENSLDVSARIDLHDARVRLAREISNMVGVLMEGREDLLKRGGFFCGEHDPLDADWLSLIVGLKGLNDLVDPRRLFRKPE